MIIYDNNGLIPLGAIRLMGASVKTEGSFGRFGTGFKYALATILRGGGSIKVWRGQDQVTFFTEDVDIKGETFQEVWMTTVKPMDGRGVIDTEHTALGFTTQLGKDWEPWMAHRELACNARDEDGDFHIMTPEDFDGMLWGTPDEAHKTVIIVDWAELDEAASGDVEHVFAPPVEALIEERGVRVLPGPSNYLYHRGVRVWKLPKPSVFTYDITKPVDLTEDRSVKYGFIVLADVRNMVLDCSDPAIVEAVVSASKDNWESGFDWKGEEWSPSKPSLVWLEVVAGQRERGHISASAREVLVSHKAFREVTRGSSWSDITGANRSLSDAAEALDEMGFDLEEVNVYIVQELPGGAASAVRDKAIYLTNGLLDRRRHLVVRELLGRFLEREGEGDHDKLLEAVSKRFYALAQERVYWLRRDEELYAEEREAGLYDHTEETCPGHVGSPGNLKVCARCGTHVDSLRPDDDEPPARPMPAWADDPIY